MFSADWAVTMVGLDVTHQVNLTRQALDRIEPLGVVSGIQRLMLLAQLPTRSAAEQGGEEARTGRCRGIARTAVVGGDVAEHLLDVGAATLP